MPTLTVAEVKKLKVAELREALGQRGLSTKGLKAQLAERLIEAVEAEVSEAPPPEQEEEDPPAPREDPQSQGGDGGEEDLAAGGEKRPAPGDGAPGEEEERAEEPPRRRARVEGPVEVEEKTEKEEEAAPESGPAEPSPPAQDPEPEQEGNHDEDKEQEAASAPTRTQAPTDLPSDATISVRIEGFVRPFTLKQARALVEEHAGGGLLEGEQGFWMNSIKSHALATFVDAEHAAAAHRNLQGLRWPQASTKLLETSFSSVSAGSKAQVTAPSTLGRIAEKLQEERALAEERRLRAEALKSLRTAGGGQQRQEEPAARGGGAEETRGPAGRGDAPTPRGRGFFERLRPQLTVDEIFRKTRAAPPVYWLPLTEAEVERKRERREEAEKRSTVDGRPRD